jgi:hypothetical protein
VGFQDADLICSIVCMWEGVPVPDLTHSNAHVEGMDVGEGSLEVDLICCSIEHVDGQGVGYGVSVLDLTEERSQEADLICSIESVDRQCVG